MNSRKIFKRKYLVLGEEQLFNLFIRECLYVFYIKFSHVKCYILIIHYRACISLANSLLTFYFLQMHWTSLLASQAQPPSASLHNCVKLTITRSQDHRITPRIENVTETFSCQSPEPTLHTRHNTSVSLASRLVLTDFFVMDISYL